MVVPCDKRPVAVVARTGKLTTPKPVNLQKYVVLALVLQGLTGVAAKTAEPHCCGARHVEMAMDY